MSESSQIVTLSEIMAHKGPEGSECGPESLTFVREYRVPGKKHSIHNTPAHMKCMKCGATWPESTILREK